MELKDSLKLIADRVAKLKDQISTEEATKNAFIMPFIQSLGYDVFNPLEVQPEFVSDIGIKKGEKIDYAIIKDGKPVILIECKHWNQNLNIHDGQLLRYFHTSAAKFGVLTNGIIYRFYTDLVAPNKMDEKPFLEFNITDLRDNQIEEISKFHTMHFNIENIVNTASELKYMTQLKQLIQKELQTPSVELVKHFTRQVYPGPITSKVLDQFTLLTQKSIHQEISEMITDRLKSALKKEDAENKIEIIPQEQTKVVTTEEEMEAFLIIKAILRKDIPSSRIFFRDAQTYFAILLDDNNRRTICRFYFNGSKKYVAVLDLDKKEIKHEITTMDDIFNHSELLIKIANELNT